MAETIKTLQACNCLQWVKCERQEAKKKTNFNLNNYHRQ